jgi:hypothetical protein
MKPNPYPGSLLNEIRSEAKAVDPEFKKVLKSKLEDQKKLLKSPNIFKTSTPEQVKNYFKKSNGDT